MTYETRIPPKRGLRRPPCYFTVRLAPPCRLRATFNLLPWLASSLSGEDRASSLASLPTVHESLGKLLSSSCKRLPDRPSLHLLSSCRRLYLSSLVSLYISPPLSRLSLAHSPPPYFSLFRRTVHSREDLFSTCLETDIRDVKKVAFKNNYFPTIFLVSITPRA